MVLLDINIGLYLSTCENYKGVYPQSDWSLAIVDFPIKFGRNAQWEHLFPMYFDDFLPISLIFFYLKVHFSMKK